MRHGTKRFSGDVARLLRFEPKTPEEWAGRARMADARRAAGVDLDDLDVEALARAEGDRAER